MKAFVLLPIGGVLILCITSGHLYDRPISILFASAFIGFGLGKLADVIETRLMCHLEKKAKAAFLLVADLLALLALYLIVSDNPAVLTLISGLFIGAAAGGWMSKEERQCNE